MTYVKNLTRSFIFLILFATSSSGIAFDVNYFGKNSLLTFDTILKKYKLTKDTKYPATIKEENQNIEIDFKNNPTPELKLAFETPINFPYEEKDSFEKIESSKKRDILNDELIIAIPTKGYIYFLNQNLKVTAFKLIPPWKPNELKSLKSILDELVHPPVIFNKKNKRK